MNFQFFVEKLEGSEEYSKFKKENPDAYFCSGFFTFDVTNKGKENEYHMDFFEPKEKKLFSFKLENGIELVPSQVFEGQEFEELSMSGDFDFDDFRDMIDKKMEENKIKSTIQKILFSFQKVDGRDFLVGTIFVTGFGMLQINIDIEKKEVTKFEKKSFLDILKITKKGE